MPLWPFMGANFAAGGGPVPPIALAVAAGITFQDINTDTIDSGSHTLTTATGNVLIIAEIGMIRSTANAGVTVSSVSSTSGLTWTRIGFISGTVAGDNMRQEVWVAPSATALASEVITFHLSASVPSANACAAGAFIGVVGSSLVYTLDGTVLTDLDAAVPPVVSMTTTHGYDLLIFAGEGLPNDNGAPPAGWSTLGQINSSNGLHNNHSGLSYKIVTTTQSGVSLTPAAPNSRGCCVAFALRGP